jgi:Rieske Fe-S protein
MERRQFLNNLAKGAGTLVVLPAVLASCSDDPGGPDNILEIDLLDNQYNALNSPGGYVVRNNIIVINSGGQFIALSSVCTHSGCQVTYNSASNELPCNCHGSRFSVSGSVLEGPANRPLKEYSITRDGDLLTIEL